MIEHQPVTLEAAQAAREALPEQAKNTPLVRLNIEDAPAEIYLKLENLQPIGSFKIRGAANAIASADPSRLAKGVYTSSAGNMAQGVAWNARRTGLACTVVVPVSAPQVKIEAIHRLGAKTIPVPYETWWQVMIDHHYEPLAEAFFIHPSSDPAVMAGNASIGLEILEALPDVDAVVIPFGSGGLSSGIASVLRARETEARVFVAECETGAPVAAAIAAGKAVNVEYRSSFVDGISAPSLLPEMWPLVQQLIDDSLVCSLAEIADAIRLLVERNRIVAEGAGGAPVAAAMAGKAGSGKVVCVVSGGNIDPEKLATILEGGVP